MSYDIQSSNRMPLSGVFKNIIAKVQLELDTDIEFKILGGETKIDSDVVPKLISSLEEVLANAVNHGLGDSLAGVVILRAYHQAGTVVIEISDNGKGLNSEKILNIAKKKKIVDSTRVLSEFEIYNLIFDSAFTQHQTEEANVDRRVGLYYVRRCIESLRGSVFINSNKEDGVKITLRLPLRASTIKGFHFCVGDESFIIPSNMIDEHVSLTEVQIDELNVHDSISFRDETLPIIHVGEYLGNSYSRQKTSNYNLVVLTADNLKIGILVDKIYNETHSVLKHLGRTYHESSYFTGFSILENGKLALILDTYNIIMSRLEREGNHIIFLLKISY